MAKSVRAGRQVVIQPSSREEAPSGRIVRAMIRDCIVIAQELTTQLLRERGYLIRGSIGVRLRKCGNPACRCAKGRLHRSKVLTASVNGRAKQVHLPRCAEADVERGVVRYRRLRNTRARLAEIYKAQLEAVDQLTLLLLSPYPPARPFPPPRARKSAARRRDESK